MLKKATTLAIMAVDTEENEPFKIWGDVFNVFSSLLARNPKSNETTSELSAWSKFNVAKLSRTDAAESSAALTL